MRWAAPPIIARSTSQGTPTFDRPVSTGGESINLKTCFFSVLLFDCCSLCQTTVEFDACCFFSESTILSSSRTRHHNRPTKSSKAPQDATANNCFFMRPIPVSSLVMNRRLYAAQPFLIQHCLHFLPLPQGQGSLRPTFGSKLRIGSIFLSASVPAMAACCWRSISLAGLASSLIACDSTHVLPTKPSSSCSILKIRSVT